MRSIFAMHNETVNIWSHLVASLYFLACVSVRTSSDVFLLAYNLCALACFVSSVLFHVFMPQSVSVYTRLQRIDYAGIFVLIGGSSIPIYSIQLRCYPAVETAAGVQSEPSSPALAIPSRSSERLLVHVDRSCVYLCGDCDARVSGGDAAVVWRRYSVRKAPADCGVCQLCPSLHRLRRLGAGVCAPSRPLPNTTKKA
jgi:hypothetical protein